MERKEIVIVITHSIDVVVVIVRKRHLIKY